MDVFTLAITSVGIGLIVGFLSGLLGIGGGTVLVPVFRLLFGLPAIGSTATSLFTIIPTSLSGAVTHIRKKTCIPLLGLAAGLGGACTSSIGVWLSSISQEWMIMGATAIVIIYSAFTMITKAMRMRPSAKGAKPAIKINLGVEGESRSSEVAATDGKETGVAATDDGATLAAAVGTNVATEVAVADEKETGVAATDDGATGTSAIADEKAPGAAAIHDTVAEIPIAASMPKGRMFGLGFLIGAIAGVMSGYVGVGGGFLMVPMFMQLLKAPMKLTSGTSLIAVMILAIPGTITNGIMGNIDWIAGIFVTIGTIPGATFGSRFIKRVPEFQLRVMFSIFLIIAAILLILNEVGVSS